MTSVVCRVPKCKEAVRWLGYCYLHYHLRRSRKRRGLPYTDMALMKKLHNHCGTKGSKNPNWRGGVAEYPNHSKMKKARLLVLESANWICADCGGKATEIHHIDGSKDNHAIENLSPTCHRCNMLHHRNAIGRRPLFDLVKVRYIRKQSSLRISGVAIARMMNTSPTMIHRVLRFKSPYNYI